MSTLEINKHQIYLKKAVILVESWHENHPQKLLQGKPVETVIQYTTKCLTVLQNVHERYINFLRKTIMEGNKQSP